MTSKTELRFSIKNSLKLLSTSEMQIKSSEICKKLEQHEEFKNAQTILSYWPLNTEVDIQSINILYYKKKKMLLPCISNNNIIVKPFNGIENLIAGKYGIFEPNTVEYIDLLNIDLIIVPGLAFDKNNNRLGRGKGYYDRFLKNTNAFKIGICFDFQYLETLPIDQTDEAVDEIIFY